MKDFSEAASPNSDVQEVAADRRPPRSHEDAPPERHHLQECSVSTTGYKCLHRFELPKEAYASLTMRLSMQSEAQFIWIATENLATQIETELRMPKKL